MAVDLETLEIKIEASASGASKSLDDLAKSLQNVKGALKGANKTAADIEKVGQAAGNAAKGVSKAKTETKNTEKTFDSAAGSAKRFSMSLSDITKASGKVESGIKGIFGGLKTGSATSFLGGITNLGKVFGQIGASAGNGGAATAMSEAGTAASEAGAAAGEAGAAAVASAGGWQAVVAVVGVKLVQALGKAFLQYQKLKFAIATAPLKALVGKIGEINGKLGQLFSSLKRIATYRILRTILKEIGEGFSTGLENAYYFSQVTGGSLAKSLDLISTEFLYLKNSIGAAVAPLINALAPAVEYVVDKFVGLLNIVNQFLSALGIGGKWIKAVKYPAKYGDALDKATGSAKELKRTILGIDELNPLDSNNDSGKGGSGYSASDYASMFEYEEIAPQISDFAGQIKAAIEKGDWKGAGSLLGEKLNVLIKKANSLVDWNNGTGEKITKFLTNITSAFNGFIQSFDGKAAGELVGNAIQTAFNSIGVVFTTTDFATLAGKITDFINGALKKIDGKKIGATIKLVVSSLLRTFTTTLMGVDKKELAEDISGFFEGLDAPTIFKDLITTMSAVKEVIWPPIWEGLKGIGKDIIGALWEDFVLTDPTGAPGWANVVQKLIGFGQLISGNIIGGFALIFGDNIFGKVKEGLESLANKISEKLPGLSKIAAAVYSKVAEIWNGIIGKLIEWASKSPFTSWLVPHLQKGMINTGEKSGADYRTGVKTELSKSMAKSGFEPFRTNLNTATNLGKAGETGAGNYRTSLKDKLLAVFNPKTYATMRTNLNTATDLGSSGKIGGDNYRTGVKTELSKSMAKSGFATLRTNLNTATNLGSSGKTGGGDYRSAFEEALAAGLTPAEAEQVAKFATAISTNVTTDGKKTRGATTASKFTTDFFNKIETNAGTTGTTFGSSVKGNILSKNGIDPSGINSKTRSTLLDKFKEGTSVGKSLGGAVKTNIQNGINPSGINSSTRTTLVDKFGESTTIGKTFGTKVGKNISDGIKDGLRKHPVTVSLNLPNYTTGGGGNYSATMEVAATGGVFNSGQYFIANESGPELVGNIGRKTAVANTTQMVDAMAQGVYQANAESNMLLRQIIQYAAEIAAKEYASGGEVTVESITSAMTRNNRRLGKTVVAVGA